MPGKREYVKGKHYELLLARKLRKMGFFVVRAPASGRGKARRPFPDLVAIRSGKVFFIEVKERGDNRPIHVPKRLRDHFLSMAARAGAEFLLCVFYRSVGEFRCLELAACDYESKEYCVFRYRTFLEAGRRIEEVFG